MVAGPDRAPAVPWRCALEQGPVLASFARVLLGTVRSHPGGPVPGPELVRHMRAPSARLVRAYLQHLGAPDDGVTLPPHLYPHWCFPLLGALARGVPFSLASAVNGSCAIRVRRPLPRGEPLEVRGRLASVETAERGARACFMFSTSSPSAPDALETEVTLRVPRRASAARPAPSPEALLIPADAVRVGDLRGSRRAGLDFAKVTGDFNPIHWSRLAARRRGFPDVILHGFGTLARAWVVLSHTRPLRQVEARFTRPVVLPAELGVYERASEVWVGEGPGDVARLMGRFEG